MKKKPPQIFGNVRFTDRSADLFGAFFSKKLLNTEVLMFQALHYDMRKDESEPVTLQIMTIFGNVRIIPKITLRRIDEQS